jgi:hypothetical protein
MAIGVKVKLRTLEVEVPSLTFDEVERFSTDGTLGRIPTPEYAAKGMLIPEVRAAMMKALLAALSHGEVQFTREQVAAELDLENVGRVFAALMGACRLERKENDAGEAVPQTP